MIMFCVVHLMERMMKKSFVCLAGFLLVGSFPLMGFAEDCFNIGTNQEWQIHQQDFADAVDSEEYDKALEYADKLNRICSTSPALNYSVGMIYQRKGDDENAIKYIKKAIDNPDGFELDESVVKTFHSTLYEIMEGYQAKLKAENAAKDAQYKENLDKSNDDMKRTLTEFSEVKRLAADNELSRAKVVMWTGTGVGALGLVTTIVGAVLAAKDDSEAEITDIGGCNGNTCTFKKEEEENLWKVETLGEATLTYKITSYKKPGFALIGAGIGMTIAGAVMAGIGAYHYTHPSMGVALSDDVALSFDVSPTNLQVGLTF